METQVKIKTYIILVDHIQWSKIVIMSSVLQSSEVNGSRGWFYAIKTHWDFSQKCPVEDIKVCILFPSSLAPCCVSPGASIKCPSWSFQIHLMRHPDSTWQGFFFPLLLCHLKLFWFICEKFTFANWKTLLWLPVTNLPSDTFIQPD